MAGKMPLFTSAPRIVLTFEGARIGFAVGFNINISVDVEAVYCIGQYNAAYLEPKMVNPVNGTIQVLKLATGTAKDTNNPIGTGFALGHLDPSMVIATALFDMDVYIKTPQVLSMSAWTQVTTTTAETTAMKDGLPDYSHGKTSSDSKTESPFADKLAVGKAKNAAGQVVKWMQIKQVRLTARNANITLGQLVNEPVSFQGLLISPETENFSLDSTVKPA